MGTLAESDHIMAFQRTLRRPDQRLRDLSLPEMGTRLAVVDLAASAWTWKKKKKVYILLPQPKLSGMARDNTQQQGCDSSHACNIYPFPITNSVIWLSRPSCNYNDDSIESDATSTSVCLSPFS